MKSTILFCEISSNEAKRGVDVACLRMTYVVGLMKMELSYK